MVTNNDLEKIGRVVDEKLESKLEQKLKPIRKDIRYLIKTVSVAIKRFDEADVKLGRRVTRIERHLSLPQEN